MTQELQIPKRRSPVEVVMTDGTALKVDIFLSEFAQDHAGGERASDLLNGPHDFLPAVDSAQECLVLINRDHLVLMSVPRDLESTAADLPTIATEHEVELHMAGAQTVRGLITYELPPESSRLVDFLNTSPTYFSVLTDERVVLVNKRHIHRASPVQR